MDPGFTVADPLGARLLLDRTWESWLPEALSDPAATEPVRQAIERGLSLERLRELTFALVDQRDVLAGLPGPAEFAEPPPILSQEVRATIERLAAVARGAAKDPEDRAAQALEELAAWVRQTAAMPESDQVRRSWGPRGCRTSPSGSATRPSGGTAPRSTSAGPVSARCGSGSRPPGRWLGTTWWLASLAGRRASVTPTTAPRAGRAASTSRPAPPRAQLGPRSSGRAARLPAGDPVPPRGRVPGH